jgi:hypothetical protein
VLDFCDTLFMVLGKKTRQFTLLHVWHHASIVPLFGYYLSTGMGGGFIAALPLWNSLVHVIMYSHYLVTSIFTFKRMWWKPIITASQMGHHMLIMMYMILNRVYVRTAANHSAMLAAASLPFNTPTRLHRFTDVPCVCRRILSVHGQCAYTLSCGASQSLVYSHISSCSRTSRPSRLSRGETQSRRLADG